MKRWHIGGALAATLGIWPLLAGAQTVAPPPPAAAPSVAAEPVVLPFELASNKIYMKTFVNDQGPYPFVLDTGSPITVLDWDLATTLGLKVSSAGRVGGAGEGSTKLGTAKGVHLGVSELRLEPSRISVVPLNSTLSQAEGRDVRGLLGGDLLQRFVSEFDFEANVVRLHDRGSFDYKGPGERVPIRLTGHVLARATITIAGREPITGRFIIDTGARVAVSLNTPVVAANRLLAGDIPHVRTTVGWGLGGALEHGLARAETLSIGAVTFTGPTVTLSEDKAGVFASANITGVIGNEVLKRCRIYFDYQRKEIILEPIEAAMNSPFPADASGLFITAGGDDLHEYTVRTVVEGSPAMEAGIKPGDIIEQLNGPASRLTLEDLRVLLREAGRTFDMEVQRGDERLKLTLTTRSLI